MSNAAIARLKTLPGIGEWTAQYLAMRAFAWPDAFPAGDLGIRKALGMDDERKRHRACADLAPVARLCRHAFMEIAGMNTWITTFDSPVGPLLLMSDGTALTGLHTDRDKHRPMPRGDWVRDAAIEPFGRTCTQLQAYFAGRLVEFDLPLAPRGTAFQMIVWRELRRIAYGETISYAELARRIGRPTAARAVGHSNARNPISIVIPCHRVIGADNSLTGYAGGLDRKRLLLQHEAAFCGGQPEDAAAVGSQLVLAGL